MPAAILDLNDDLIIEQGAFWPLYLSYPGNQTGAFLRGEIRKGFGGEIVARFAFGTPTWDETTNKTSFLVYLNSGITRKMALPPDDPGYWRYDILFQSPGKEPIRLVQGRAFISPGVTE